MILSMQFDWSGIEYVLGVETDPGEIVDFWKRNNITVTKTDTPGDIRQAAHVYPKLFIVAKYSPRPQTEHTEKKIIGTVWGNYDGRRGYIVHLAVEQEYRSRGLGHRLMDLVEEEFRRMDVYKIHLFVESHNNKVGGFYNQLGYKKRSDLTVYSKTL